MTSIVVYKNRLTCVCACVQISLLLPGQHVYNRCVHAHKQYIPCMHACILWKDMHSVRCTQGDALVVELHVLIMCLLLLHLLSCVVYVHACSVHVAAAVVPGETFCVVIGQYTIVGGRRC